ncbi:MAG TPA: ROK family protein [Atribacteraceae bacterium]|nr:ROK family protein [Atribacteraceae bacterium]
MPNQVFLGIDLSGSTTKVGAVGSEGHILFNSTIPTRPMREPEEVVADIEQEAKKLCKEAQRAGYTLAAIGIGLPGLCDWEAGVCHLLPNFHQKWKYVPIKKWLEERLGLPVAAINDVRAITLAENRFGAGREVANMVMLSVGTGIGGGLILNGELFSGREGGAGEIGHIPVEPFGIRCGCGSRGCLEAYASGPAMVGQALRALVQQHDTLIRELVKDDLNKVTPKTIVDAAKAGDETATDIIMRTGFYIGLALSGICAVINPEMIVVGGTVTQVGDILFDRIRQSLRERLHILPVNTIRFVQAELGREAAVIGTATWSKEQFLKGLISLDRED